MWSSYICFSLIVASLLGLGLWVSLGKDSHKDGKSSK